MKHLLVLFFISFRMITLSQINTKNTFDFWIGSWDAYWNDSLQGTNTITKILGNAVVEENFLFNDGTFSGKSWSVYDSSKNLWRQTWVDNSGSYLVFTGGLEDDKVVLKMTDKRTKSGKPLEMRMIFFNIKKDTFDWDWQSSPDGINWRSEWFITYIRKK